MKPDGFERVALSSLTQGLRVCFRRDPPEGYRDGKDRIRSLVMRMYDCDPDRAQRLVNHLEAEGYISLVDRRGRRHRRRGGDEHRSAGPAPHPSSRWQFTPLAVRPD